MIVDARLRITLEGATPNPIAKRAPRAGIAVVRRPVTRLIESELKANDVLRVAIMEGFLFGCIDDIVRRRHHIDDMTDHLRIVQSAVKWNNGRHCVASTP